VYLIKCVQFIIGVCCKTLELCPFQLYTLLHFYFGVDFNRYRVPLNDRKQYTPLNQRYFFFT